MLVCPSHPRHDDVGMPCCASPMSASKLGWSNVLRSVRAMHIAVLVSYVCVAVRVSVCICTCICMLQDVYLYVAVRVSYVCVHAVLNCSAPEGH